MSAHCERIKLDDTTEREYFSVRWDFVNTYLTHVDVDDPEPILRDLIDLERGLNQ